MVMRWLPDEEAVKTLFEKLSFTVDISCDLISYQMLGEAHEIAAQDYKAFDDLSSLSCLTRVMVLPFLEWMWRISIQACCQHINFQVSSSHAQAQGVEKKSDLHLFGWKHLNAVILYCYHSNENN